MEVSRTLETSCRKRMTPGTGVPGYVGTPMTKANHLQLSLLCLSLVIGHWSLVIPAIAQPPTHKLFRGDMPPGHIGKMQLLKAGRAGYYQPVEVRGPKGSLVSLASEGTFLPAESNVAAGGMLI